MFLSSHLPFLIVCFIMGRNLRLRVVLLMMDDCGSCNGSKRFWEGGEVKLDIRGNIEDRLFCVK